MVNISLTTCKYFANISYDNFHHYLMKTQNYLDCCLQSCFLEKITIGLPWNVLCVVHILAVAHRLELMQAIVILLAVNIQ